MPEKLKLILKVPVIIIILFPSFTLKKQFAISSPLPQSVNDSLVIVSGHIQDSLTGIGIGNVMITYKELPYGNFVGIIKSRESDGYYSYRTFGHDKYIIEISSEEYLKKINKDPFARFLAFSARGVAPEVMGIGPIAAIPDALRLAGLKQDDIDLIELNEAFAAQSLAVIRELGLDEEKTNPNGGAIALGHPLGCTGAKLTVQIMHEMVRRDLSMGLVTMCIGGGMGAAGIFERVN